MSSTGKLDGKVAIVTGASSGIGECVAMMFAKEGAKVVLASRTESKLQAVCEDIKKTTGAEVTYCAADVSTDEGNKKIVETAMSTFGGLHVSFINAGVVRYSSLMDASDEVIDSMLNPNFKGVVFGLKYQLPAMSKSSDKGSIIVNTTGLASRCAPSMSTAGLYACSKAAAEMAIRYGAVEGAPMNVRVNGVAPGVVSTPINEAMGDDGRKELAKRAHLTEKLMTPEDIAPAVVFLASDDARVMTGAIHPVDGGASLKVS